MTYKATLGEVERWADSRGTLELLHQWIGDGKKIAVYQGPDGRRSFSTYQTEPDEYQLVAIYEGAVEWP